MQIFCWFSFSVTMSLHPRFSFNMHAWLCLIHLCMDIHVWWPFRHLKVQKGQCKFSVGSVSPSLCHCILGSVSTCKCGYAEDIYAWTFMCDELSALKSALCTFKCRKLITHDANFPLIQLITHDANFPLIQFSKFSIGSVFPGTHPIIGLVLTFKTFMHGHSCMMTFLHLKVQNGQYKFSIGSVSLSPCHCILSLVSTCKHGYAENIYAWTCMRDDLSALKSA